MTHIRIGMTAIFVVCIALATPLSKTRIKMLSIMSAMAMLDVVVRVSLKSSSPAVVVVIASRLANCPTFEAFSRSIA